MQLADLIAHNNKGRFTKGLGGGWRYFRLSNGFSLVNDAYGTRIGLSICIDITEPTESQLKVYRVYGQNDEELILKGSLMESENIRLDRLHYGLYKHVQLTFGY